MSASNERKEELARQRREEEKKHRSTMRLYGVVGAICAVAVAAVLVLNSGLLQRTLPAVTVNGTDFSAADMEYYYNTQYQATAQSSQYYAMYYGIDMGFDYTADPADQIYDQTTGQTWEEYFRESARQSVTYITAAYDAAVAAGHSLSAEALSAMSQMEASIDNVWKSSGVYSSRDQFLRATYGPYITYDRLMELLEMELMAQDFANTKAMELTYTDEQYKAYYEENKDNLDTITVSQFVLQARVPAAAEGEEMTEEEQAAALEQLKAEKKAVAEEMLAKLSAGVEPEVLEQEYAEELFSASIMDGRVGDSVTSTDYADWALDSGRQSGDTTLAEYEGSGFHNYYVVRWESRELDTSNTANIRHILVAAQTDPGASAPTEEQYAAAKEEAEALLKSWQEGEATEEAFAQLAAANSADSGSAANGGLMEGISAADNYVKTFMDWCLDSSRKDGDTGIIQNTGSTIKGWHIMYYVSDGLPVWEMTADNALRSADYAAWESEMVEGYEAVDGFGMKFL